MNDGLKMGFEIVLPAPQRDGSQSKLALGTAPTPAVAQGSAAQILKPPVQYIETHGKASAPCSHSETVHQLNIFASCLQCLCWN